MQSSPSDLVLPELGEVWQQTLGWQPDSDKVQQFQALYSQILAVNTQLNLTRITKPLEFWEKHLWDSLYGVRPWLNGGSEGGQLSSLAMIGDQVQGCIEPTLYAPLKVIDIGTGAGFPGLPLALVQPRWIMTLLDSTRKKIVFLDRLQQTLSLTNVLTCCERAEHLGQIASYRQTFDMAVMRAVSSVTVCAEYALPLLKLDGLAILYRGQWTSDDHQALVNALDQLGGVIAAVRSVQTPLTQAQRHCVYIRKLTSTPSEFPVAWVCRLSSRCNLLFMD